MLNYIIIVLILKQLFSIISIFWAFYYLIDNIFYKFVDLFTNPSKSKKTLHPALLHGIGSTYVALLLFFKLPE